MLVIEKDFTNEERKFLVISEKEDIVVSIIIISFHNKNSILGLMIIITWIILIQDVVKIIHSLVIMKDYQENREEMLITNIIDDICIEDNGDGLKDKD